MSQRQTGQIIQHENALFRLFSWFIYFYFYSGCSLSRYFPGLQLLLCKYSLTEAGRGVKITRFNIYNSVYTFLARLLYLLKPNSVSFPKQWASPSLSLAFILMVQFSEALQNQSPLSKRISNIIFESQV